MIDLKINLTKKRKIIIAIALLVGLAIVAYLATNQGTEVDYYTIDSGNVIDKIDSDAKIQSDEVNTLYALVNGEISEILFEVGDQVNAGDEIATIDSESIENQIKGIEAQINQVNYTLKERAAPADQERFDKLEYEMNALSIQLDRAEETYENNQTLFETGAISKAELDQSQDQVNILKNQISSVREDLKLLRNSISNNVEMQYQAQIQGLEAQKATLENSLNNTTITSDYQGVITEKMVQKGQFITQGQPIVEVANLDTITLMADVLESDVNQISKSTKVLIEDSIADQMVEGTITKIYPKIYSEISELGIKQNKVNIEVTPTSLSNGYLLNQNIEISFVIDERENVIRVPLESYYATNGESYVFINDGGEAVSKTIKVGLEGEDYIEVTEGLAEGDEIIETLDTEIEEGMKIQ